ncbi:MAG: mechanosensitive ion channel [Nanoarchaeota archaeon]|nr:mechanosensitive ion channel [Nanoarchaeota archaeon]
MIETIKNKLLFLKNPHFFSSIYYKFIILVVIGYLWYTNKDFLNTHKVLYDIIFLIFHYFILNIVFNYGKLVIIYIYLKKNDLQSGYTDNLTVGIERLSFFLNHFLYILILVDVLFIDIKLLLTSLSIVAVATVLIFKEFIANFLNGITLMFSKDFRIKDTVKIGDSKGKIVDFTFHNVQLRNENGDIIFIPNSTFLNKEITNYSRASLKNISIEATILRKDLEKFEEKKEIIINDIFKNYTENIQNKDNINILITKLEKEIITLTFELYLPKFSSSTEKAIKTFILKEIGLLFPNKTIKKEN